MKPSFSKNLGPIKAKDIKSTIKCNFHNINDDCVFSHFLSIKRSNANTLSFINDNEFSPNVEYPSGTFICSSSTFKKFTGKNPLIIVNNVHETVAKISNLFFRSLSLDEINALDVPKIGVNCQIARSAIIENGVVIGNNVKIGSGGHIGHNCVIGDNTTIDNNTVVTNSIIAENVCIGRNSSLGQQGFGFAISKNKNIKIFHSGRLIIQEGVYIGSNCTIDRGSFGDTIIGQNTYFDNLCHVAHNVTIGNNCIFAAMTGIAGSTKVGNGVMTGGQVGIAGHLDIGDNVQIAAQSGVIKDIDDDSSVMGYPAIDKFKYLRNFKKNYA